MSGRSKTSVPTISRDLFSAISSRELASGALLCVWPDGRITERYGREVAPASLSARQAKAVGLMMSGTYGPPSNGSSKSVDLSPSLASKLRARTERRETISFPGKRSCAAGRRLVSKTGRMAVPTGIGSPAGVCGLDGLDDALRFGRGQGRGNDAGNVGVELSPASAAGGVADACGEDQGRRGILGSGESDRSGSGAACERSAGFRANGGLAVSDGGGHASRGLLAGQGGSVEAAPVDDGHSEDGRVSLHPLNYWADADWLLCRDPDGPRFRPVEPGSFPLVDAGSLRNRLAAVRGAGNAINLAQAQAFCEVAIEVIAELEA